MKNPRAPFFRTRHHFPLLLAKRVKANVYSTTRKSPPFEDFIGGERPESLLRGSGYIGKGENHACDTSCYSLNKSVGSVWEMTFSRNAINVCCVTRTGDGAR